MPAYNGVDYIDFDSLLNDEEKLARQAARQFVEAEVIPIIEKHSREGTFPQASRSATRRTRFLRRQPPWLRLRRHVQRRLRPRHPGTRARRLRSPQLRLRAKRARHVSDLRLRQRRAKRQMAPAPRAGQSHRLLRPHRTAIRFESRRHAHARREKREQVHPQRRKNVDHQRLHRRRRRRVGQV